VAGDKKILKLHRTCTLSCLILSPHSSSFSSSSPSSPSCPSSYPPPTPLSLYLPFLYLFISPCPSRLLFPPHPIFLTLFLLLLPHPLLHSFSSTTLSSIPSPPPLHLGEAAGLLRIKLLREPEAAALAYGLTQR
jgi:hypothetical protein